MKSLIATERPYKDKVEIVDGITVRLKDLYRERYRIDFNPSYQRGLVWTIVQKREYIENLFKGIAEIKPTIVDEIRENKDESVLEILDGKQRLSTLFEFIDNKLSLLVESKEIYFKDLLEIDKNYILRFDVKYKRIMNNINIMEPVPLKYKLMLFLEINSLGTKARDCDINRIKDILLEESS